MSKLIRFFVDINVKFSKFFDKILPAFFSVDGNRYFEDYFVSDYIGDNQTILEVGGGKTPFITHSMKKDRNLVVYGLDIDANELERAPTGIYDKAVVADICHYREGMDVDLIIAQAVMEHVPDGEAALRGLHALLKKGGTVVIFLPTKYAVFGIINRTLPEGLKKKLLFTIYPDTEYAQGFKAYYSKASIDDYKKLAKKIGFEVIDVKPFYVSSYFRFIFPVYVMWRVWIILFYLANKNQAAETFCISLRKK